mmetsp:Transcript_76902/g.178358  ORF Transcript_76902/g.178358 Transcript_76902/m.178358 type:complete len:559 (-) Transcript_76902:57-1733(-)
MQIHASASVMLGLHALSLLSLTAADSFLSKSAVKGHDLLEELEEALGGKFRQATEARMDRLQDMLSPMFAALPKNSFAAVGAPAASYALHRLFVQQHGWQLKGLDPSGGSWAETSPTKAFGNRLPQEVRARFEEHLGAKGLDLHELALVAAVLEHTVHGEAESRLESIYKALGHELEALLKEHEAARVIDICMATYILGANTSVMTRASLVMFNSSIEEQHPTWAETRGFLREVQQSVSGGKAALSFSDVAAVVEAAADRFGRWQSTECRTLKDQLVQLEEAKGTGRVRLADFYGSAIHHGQWQFSETVDYLRQLGAIDESDPASLRVIIPNYLYSPTNCLASSSFYAVCCIDECEDLLGGLERQLGRHTASSDEIIAFMNAQGGKALTAGLIKRLQEVAEHHSARVPLHGRLFAQWLHHARPRECPFPHISGTTQPQRPDEWEIDAGKETTATQDEMLQHIGAGRRRPAAEPSAEEDDQGLCSPMWTMEEELVDPHAHKVDAGVKAPVTRAGRGIFKFFRWVAVSAAMGSLLFALVKTLKPVCAVEEVGSKLPKYFV